jgi:hypothetical protein
MKTSNLFRHSLVATGLIVIAAGWVNPASAGPVLLTGHDPDFHAQGQQSGVDQLNIILNYVTSGTYNTGTQKFLFVESNLPATSGHRIGEQGLTTPGVGLPSGLVSGVNFDQVNAAGLAALPNFNGYSAIVVASDFGGMLTDAEITELVARKADIAAFVNAGGGLAAFAECGVGFGNCIPDLVNASTPLFGFVPVNVSSVDTTAPYIVTPFGASLGFTDAMVSDCCTHNSFGQIGGLSVIDNDQNGIPTTLAGNVRITDGGFTPVPEPSTLALLSLCAAGLGFVRRSKQKQVA